MGFDLGGVHDFFLGDTPKAKASPFFDFDKKKKAAIGEGFADMVLDLLRNDVSDSAGFRASADFLRDATSRAGREASQRFGDSATAGGFLDSGIVTEAELGISRNAIRAEQESLAGLFQLYEQLRLQTVLPFLGAGDSSHLATQSMNVQAASAARSNNATVTAQAIQTAGQMGSSAMMASCWVVSVGHAGSIEAGWDLPETNVARAYLATTTESFRRAYTEHGERLARFAETNAVGRAIAREIARIMTARGREVVSGWTGIR